MPDEAAQQLQNDKATAITAAITSAYTTPAPGSGIVGGAYNESQKNYMKFAGWDAPGKGKPTWEDSAEFVGKSGKILITMQKQLKVSSRKPVRTLFEQEN